MTGVVSYVLNGPTPYRLGSNPHSAQNCFLNAMADRAQLNVPKLLLLSPFSVPQFLVGPRDIPTYL